MVSGVSAKCVTLCLSRFSNNGTCVWLAGVFRRRSGGLCRVYSPVICATFDAKELRLCVSVLCVGRLTCTLLF